ncbi:MAG: diguanylate cyclase [Chloroflexota bacterium]
MRARVGVAGEPLAWDGSSEGSPVTSPTTTSASGSILRRFIGSERTGRSDVPVPVSPPSADPPEAELAESLDTVLRIIGRLAASHDRRELVRMIVDETMRALRADAATIRLLREDHLELAASAGLPATIAEDVPSIGRDAGLIGEVIRAGRVMAWPDIHVDRRVTDERYPEAFDHAGHLVTPLLHGDHVVGVLTAVSREPRRWTSGEVAFMGTLASHAAIALTNAELLEQTVKRAAQLEVLETASARMSLARSIEDIGTIIVDETARIIEYHNARVYVVEAPDDVVPIAFKGRVGAYDQVDMRVLACKFGVGFTGWVAQHGEPLLVNDANADPRGETIAGTDDVDESMLVVPMRYDGSIIGVITLSKLGFAGFDADDLRVLTILADRAATAVGSARLLIRTQELAREMRRLLDMSAELSGSLDPRQVADLMAGHLATAMGVDECIISYWDRAAGMVESLGYYPPDRLKDIEPAYEVANFPETVHVLDGQVAVIVDADDPNADQAEVALMRADGNRVLAMLPLVAKGQSIGLVELISHEPIVYDDERLGLARTMANEAAMALENARLYEDARALADRDPLTGFYNHRFLHERLGEEVVRAQRARRPLSVLMLDLDDFKLVNDTFGHLFGDRVLTWTAELIRSTLRGSDIPARYGGDEFAIILPDTDGDDARRAAERILDAFRDEAFVGEQRGPVPIGASIGVATFPLEGRTATELIAGADAALYRVKHGGGHEVAGAGDAAA